MKETKPSKRLVQTPRPFAPVGGTRSTVRRLSVTPGKANMAIPDGVKSGVFKNVGTNEIRIFVNSSGSDYWTLDIGFESPRVLLSGASIDFLSVGGASTMECIFDG